MNVALAKSSRLFSTCSSMLAPPPKLSVSEHAERTLYLSERTSAISGLVNFEHTPYLPYLLDKFTDPGLTYLYWCFGTQLGKTTGLFALINYIVDCAPAPTMYQVPTMQDARSISKDRLQQLFYDCESLKSHLTGVADDFQLLTYHLDRMSVRFAWSSINSISSHPEKYVLQDETKSMEPFIAREVESRTKSFSGRKIVRTSSPRHPTDSIWLPLGLQRDYELEAAAESEIPEDTLTIPVRRYVPDGRIALSRYYVKCPNCQAPQIFHPDRIRWPRDCAIRDLTFAAWYECENCAAHLTESDKRTMVAGGDWVEETTGGNAMGVQLSSIYSLLGDACTFGEIAGQFLRAHITRRSAEMESFTTSYLAWPHEAADDGISVVNVNTLVGDSGDYLKNQLPPEVSLVCGGVDFHKDNFYYLVAGFSESDVYLLNWGIEDHAAFFDVDYPEHFLADLRAKSYQGDGRELRPVSFAIDSGYMASTIYDWCRRSRFLVPVKGRRGDVVVPDGNEKYIYSTTRIDKDPSGKTLEGGVVLRNLNTGIIKRDMFDMIDAGRLHSPSDIDQEVLRQLTSEQLFEKRNRNGKLIRYYGPRKVSEGAESLKNHYLDCLVYCLAMRDILCAGKSVTDAARRYYVKRKRPSIGQMKG